MQDNPTNQTGPITPQPAQPQPPAQPAMPKPLDDQDTAVGGGGVSETLDQQKLAEILKKADEVRPEAPTDHPAVDVSVAKPGNVIAPTNQPTGTTGATLQARPATIVTKPLSPTSLPPPMPKPPTASPAAPSPQKSPISTFMAPDIRQLDTPQSKPAPAPAPPATAQQPPKPTFLEPEEPVKPAQPTPPAVQPQQPTQPKSKKTLPFKKFGHSMLYAVEGALSGVGTRAKNASGLAILVAVLGAVVILYLVPASRFALGGLMFKKTYSVKVVDANTGDPVSLATVTSGSATATTNGNGLATFSKLKPGKHNFSVSKIYYSGQVAAETVPLFGGQSSANIGMAATGNLVRVDLTNTLTGQPVSGALIKAGQAKAMTASSGKALIAVAPGSGFQPADISSGGYNSSHPTLSVTEGDVAVADQTLTPAGTIYYLTKHGGATIVGSNLDGTAQKVVLKPSGFEGSEAELIPAPSNNYLALRARRTADPHSELYVVTIDGSDVAEIAFGQAQFSIYGWVGDSLIYSATYDNLKPWQKAITVLKSYDAQTRKTSTIFSSDAIGNSSAWAHQALPFVMLVGGSVIYGAEWTASPSAPANLTSSKSNSLNITLGDGSNPQTIASVNASTYGLAYNQNSPVSLYIKRSSLGGGADHFFSYSFGDSQPTPVLINSSQFSQAFPRYFFSPDDNLTFWAQNKAGQNNLLIGDNRGEHPVKVLDDSSFMPQGWYTNHYLLTTSGGSLYIMGTGGGTPYKVSDSYISY